MTRSVSVAFAVIAIASLCLAEPARADPAETQSATELLSATRQARDAREFDRAEQLARQGMARYQDPVWPLTLALILADKGESSEALAVLAAPWPGGLPRIEQLMAEGYASQRGGDPWRAMIAYGEVLLVQPDNEEAKEALAGVMARVRAAHGAEAVAGVNPQREADRAAALVRSSNSLPAADLATRFADTDRALALLDSLIATARETQPVDEAMVRRLRIDRLLALRDRLRMPEVIAEAQSLSETAPLPAYATEALADALLYERRPTEALAAYEAVISADPSNLNPQYGRVFALVETERLSEAVAAIEAMVTAQGTFVGYAGGPATFPNQERGYAETLAAEVRLWANDTDGGYARLETLARAAPGNPAIRRSLVSAMRARGWPRLAEQEAAIAATLDPESLPTQIMLAETALSRNRLEEAQAATDRLVVIAPEDHRVQRLSREVEVARGWSIQADLGPTWNEGGGTNAAGDEWTSSLRVESPRFVQPMRLFALADYSIAHPIEGRVSRSRAGGGIAFEGIDLSASLYGTTSWGTLSRGGAGFTLDWQASDQVSFGVAGEIFSSQTPLRALFYGITADSLSAAFRWRRNEATSIALAASGVSFSDGNDQVSAAISGEQQLWTGPHLYVTGRAGLWYTHNSQPGGPYFSPDWVVSGTGGVTVQHIAWRRYEKVFSHALSVEFGLQDQSGFPTDWIGVVSYEHRWRTDPWWEIFYSVMFDRRTYDGEPERGIGVRLGFRWRH